MSTPRSGGFERRFAAIAALVLVNAFAVTGQASWAYANLGRHWYVAAAFAATLESISLYLTSQASAALLANDKSATLRLASYAVGLLVGAMNYAAHAPDWRPNAMAVAFAMLSALSPWLWAIQSRRTHRDQLAADGLIDPRTVKIPTALWFRRPVYSWNLWSLGVTGGINHLPTLRKMLAEQTTLRALDPVDAITYAYGAVGYDSHTARVWLAERGVTVTAAQLAEASTGRPRSPLAAAPVSPAPAGMTMSREDSDRAILAGFGGKKADCVRYAFSRLGSYDQAAAYKWLKEMGFESSRSEISRIANADQRKALGEDTGSFPTVPARQLNGYAHALTGGDQ